MVMAPPPTHDSAVSLCFHGYLAFFYFTPHHDLLPHILSIHLSAVNSSAYPGIAAQSLTSRPQSLRLPGDLCPYQGYILLWQGLSDSHSI